MNIEEINSLPQNNPLGDLIENYVTQLSITEKLSFYKNSYKFLYAGKFNENELSEQDLRIFEEIKEYEKFQIPEIDPETYKTFENLYASNAFTVENAHKLFSGVVKNEEI